MFEYMAFTSRRAGDLTGLSARRLRDWRQAGIIKPTWGDGLRDPDLGPSRFYSFRDLVALRAVALLRDAGVPLRALRTVQPWLTQHRDKPWSELRLGERGREVCLDPPEIGGASECEPGRASTTIKLGDIATDLGARVEQLQQRTPDEIGRVTRQRGVMGGAWILAGTRIPTSAVWSFHEAGYDADAIIEQYPRLTTADIEAALRHERETRRTRAA